MRRKLARRSKILLSVWSAGSSPGACAGDATAAAGISSARARRRNVPRADLVDTYYQLWKCPVLHVGPYGRRTRDVYGVQTAARRHHVWRRGLCRRAQWTGRSGIRHLAFHPDSDHFSAYFWVATAGVRGNDERCAGFRRTHEGSAPGDGFASDYGRKARLSVYQRSVDLCIVRYGRWDPDGSDFEQKKPEAKKPEARIENLILASGFLASGFLP